MRMDIASAKQETACFTGHRYLQPAQTAYLASKIPLSLEMAYRQGIRTFLCGGALGFDTMAAQAVLLFRQFRPDVRLVIAVPCPGQAACWSGEDRRRYRQILASADQTVLVSDHYDSDCMHRRNRFMVDASSLLISYVTQFRGGAWYTLRYAMQQGLPVINLAISDLVEDESQYRLKEEICSCMSTFLSAFENAGTVISSPSRCRKVKIRHISGTCFRKRGTDHRM